MDHPESVWLHQLLELVNLVSGDTLTVLSGFEGLFKDALNISHALNALSHSEAEVSEPLVVESDGPVLTEELNDVWNDTLFVS